MRHAFLAVFALLAYTTAMVYEPEQQGYTQADSDSLGQLVERVTAKPRHHGRWSPAEQRAALAELWDQP